MGSLFNFSEIKGYILLLCIFLIPGRVSAQTPPPTTADDANQEFQIIEQQNRFVDNFLNIGTGEQSAYNLPVGIKKIAGNIPITLAITNIKLADNYGEITLLMKMDIPYRGYIRRKYLAASKRRYEWLGFLVNGFSPFVFSQ